ncbi:MAG TPA: hypothetical protein PLK46_12710, partial [Propioniciclava sp.]|uniref:hypothetical protein n=1 Tax=Propioniciclava sp. TaxID=2038686 RepID=UPI002BBDC2AA
MEQPEEPPDSQPGKPASRRMKLRYAGVCTRCGATLEAGEATLVPFAGSAEAAEDAGTEVAPEPAWNGDLLLSEEVFVTGVV